MAATAAALVAAELGWRAAIPQTRAEHESAEYIASSLRYLAPCAGREVRSGEQVIAGRLRAITGGEFEFAAEKRRGVHRIAFVGESTGVMLGGAAVNLLQATPDESVWQIMNCAEGGATLDHVERRASEVLRYSPDAMVVVFGHNWMMAPMPLAEWSLRTQQYLSRSRLIAGIANRLVPGGRQPVSLDRGEELRRLESFLRRIAREGRDAGVVVVLCTLTSNLWFPPLIEEAVAADSDFAAAQLDYARGRTAEAIGKLEELNASRPHPYWAFVLGTWLARDGRIEDASRQLRLALEGETREVDRATQAVNDLIRRVAREEGARLRDTEQEMRKLAVHGTPGWDVMRDHCHLQPQLIADEARAVLELAAAELGDARAVGARNPFADHDVVGWMLDGLAAVQSQLGDARARRGQRALSYFAEHWLRAEREHTDAAIGDFLAKDLFARLPAAGRTAVLTSLADGYEWTGLHARALELNRSARETAAGAAAREAELSLFERLDPARLLYARAPEVNAWLQLGLFEIASDEKAAAEAFGKALTIDPKRADTAFFGGASRRTAAD